MGDIEEVTIGFACNKGEFEELDRVISDHLNLLKLEEQKSGKLVKSN